MYDARQGRQDAQSVAHIPRDPRGARDRENAERREGAVLGRERDVLRAARVRSHRRLGGDLEDEEAAEKEGGNMSDDDELKEYAKDLAMRQGVPLSAAVA